MTPVRVLFGTYRDARAEPEGTHALRLRLGQGAREYYLLECQQETAPEPLRAASTFAAGLLGVMKLDWDYIAILDQDDNYAMLEIRPADPPSR